MSHSTRHPSHYCSSCGYCFIKVEEIQIWHRRTLWAAGMPILSLCQSPVSSPMPSEAPSSPALAEMAPPTLLGPSLIWQWRLVLQHSPRPRGAGLSGWPSQPPDGDLLYKVYGLRSQERRNAGLGPWLMPGTAHMALPEWQVLAQGLASQSWPHHPTSQPVVKATCLLSGLLIPSLTLSTPKSCLAQRLLSPQGGTPEDPN